MIWLIRELLWLLKVTFLALIWGRPKVRAEIEKKRTRQLRAELRSNDPLDGQEGSFQGHNSKRPLEALTYGNVTARIWQNYNQHGRRYFNIDLMGLAKDGRKVRHFKPTDLDDLERCVLRVRAWLRDLN